MYYLCVGHKIDVTNTKNMKYLQNAQKRWIHIRFISYNEFIWKHILKYKRQKRNLKFFINIKHIFFFL